MSIAKSTKHVIQTIGSDKLTLVAGRGYWYFIYDDAPAGLYDTRSVYTMRLGNLSLEDWVREGREFVAKMEKRRCY